MRARGACSSPALQPTHGQILNPLHCVRSQGFVTELMQDTSLGVICMGTPASIPHWVITFCLRKLPSSFKWIWDSPSLPVLICCVALLRAAAPLLPSSPEVAALQWWVSDSCFCI